MKVYLYTKIVLTAIAIGLFLNVIKEINPLVALAQRWKADGHYTVEIRHSGDIGILEKTVNGKP